MADEAVLRIVLDEGGTTPPPSPSGQAPKSNPLPAPSPPPPPPKPTYEKIDPSVWGHNPTSSAKNLLRPMQFLDDRKKEKQFFSDLLSHPELQSVNLQHELKRLGESYMENFSSMRKAFGRPDAPDDPSDAKQPPAPEVKQPEAPGEDVAHLPMPELKPSVDVHAERRRLNEERAKARASKPKPPPPPPPAPEPKPDEVDLSWMDKVVVPPEPAPKPPPAQPTETSLRTDHLAEFLKKQEAKRKKEAEDEKKLLDEFNARVAQIDAENAKELGVVSDAEDPLVKHTEEFIKKQEERRKKEKEEDERLQAELDAQNAQIDAENAKEPGITEGAKPADAGGHRPTQLPPPGGGGGGGNKPPIGEYEHVGLPGSDYYKKKKAEAEAKLLASGEQPAPDKSDIAEREDREKHLLDLEARAFLETVRKQQAAVADARKAEVEIEDEKHRLLELEGRAALEAVREARKAEIEIEDEKHRLLELEAKAFLENVRQKQATAEAAKEAEFNPKDEAQKQIEIEDRRAAVKAEKNKLRPRGIFDRMLETGESMRGMIGGTFGTVAGAGLDLAANYRKGRESGEGMGVVPVIGAAIVAVTAFTNAANNMAEKYGEYNPQIAHEQAMAEIRQVMGDMRRAQESGGELAEFVKAQSEMQQKWEDVKLAVMKKIIPVISGILEVLSGLFGIAAKKSDADKEYDDPTTVILKHGLEIPKF